MKKIFVVFFLVNIAFASFSWGGSQNFVGSINGNTITAGTGTITISPGKTIIATQDVSLDEAVAMSTKAPLASPALTGVPTAPTAADNTSTTQIATTAYAKSQDAVLHRDPDQGVALTAAASGSSGITVADNTNINFGTGNFFLSEKFLVPDWTPATAQTLWDKYSAGSSGYHIVLQTDGKLSINLYGAGGVVKLVATTAATGFVDGTEHTVTLSFNRETTSVAGSILVLYDGILIETISIAAGSGGSINSSQALNIMGELNSGRRTAGSVKHAIMGNFAPIAAEVLDMYRNGIPLKWFDPTGVSPARQTPQTSGSLVVGKEYVIDDWITTDDFTNVGGANVDGTRFIATGTTPATWAASSSLRRIGATFILGPESWQDTTPVDGSGNNLTVSYPNAGWNLTRSTRKATVASGTGLSVFTAAQGPAGANTAIQGWTSFIDSAGVTRYQPYW